MLKSVRQNSSSSYNRDSGSFCSTGWTATCIWHVRLFMGHLTFCTLDDDTLESDRPVTWYPGNWILPVPIFVAGQLRVCRHVFESGRLDFARESELLNWTRRMPEKSPSLAAPTLFLIPVVWDLGSVPGSSFPDAHYASSRIDRRKDFEPRQTIRDNLQTWCRFLQAAMAKVASTSGVVMVPRRFEMGRLRM